MIPLVITPPAREPVTVQEARLFLRLDGEEEDTLLATLITAARLMVEAASGRMLIAQGWRIVLDAWPPGGEIRLPVSPVSGIAAARVYDGAGAARTVGEGALIVDPAGDPPLVRIAAAVPSPGRTRGAIEIDVEAGYGDEPADVPAPLRQAVLRLVARWFEDRGDVVARDAERLPRGIAALIAPYRRARL